MSRERRSYLDNTHDAYRLFYTVLLTIGLGNGFSKLLHTSEGVPQNVAKLSAQEWMIFLLFVVVVLRFFLGGIRHLDREYLERDTDEILESALQRRSYRLVDFGLLTFDAGVVIVLGVSIKMPGQFFGGLLILLLVDAIWGLGLALYSGGLREDGKISTRARWGINNTVFTGILVVLFWALGSPTLGTNWIWYVAVGFLNSAIDLLSTIDAYFPPLDTEVS